MQLADFTIRWLWTVGILELSFSLQMPMTCAERLRRVSHNLLGKCVQWKLGFESLCQSYLIRHALNLANNRRCFQTFNLASHKASPCVQCTAINSLTNMHDEPEIVIATPDHVY